MEVSKVTVDLYEAQGTPDSYALRVAGEKDRPWRAQSGFGSEFKKVWSLEIELDEEPDLRNTDWEAVLARTIEAYEMSDPVLTGFRLPQLSKST